MEKSPEVDDVTSTDAGTLLFDADTLRGKKKNKMLFSFHSMVSTVENLNSVKGKTLRIHKYIFFTCSP